MLPVTSAIDTAGIPATIAAKTGTSTFFFIAHFLLAQTLLDGTPLQHPCHGYEVFHYNHLRGFGSLAATIVRTKRVQLCTGRERLAG